MLALSRKRLGFIFIHKGKCNRLFVRLCSNLDFNPLKRKRFPTHEYEPDSRIASRLCITILGNGGIGQPRCVGLFTEFKSYLFNCGENVGRFCREYEIDIHLIKHVFITQRKWENISGLPDIFVSNQVAGVHHMSLYGPPGIDQILAMLSSKKLDTKLTKKDGGYIDHTLNVDCIPISAQKETFSHPSNGRRVGKYLSKVEEPDVYCYACRIFERPGNLLPEKCIEYGVPIGPELIKLKNFENIVLPCGRTVYAEDVHAPSCPGKIILIVDCPSESFLKSFVNEKQFMKYQAPLHTAPQVFVFHFTPSHIFKSEKYQGWIKKFCSTTKHFILNSDNSVISSNVVHQTVKYFNMLHPTIFSKLKEKELLPKQDPLISDNFMYPLPMMQIYLRPKEEFSWSNVYKEEDDLNISTDGRYIVEKNSDFDEKIQNLKTEILKKTLGNATNKKYPEILFLGTSSALATAYRNVSAILVNTSSDNSILLDCGEGTIMQMTRYFGLDLNSALKKISCIFISHKHLDHYIGLFDLISQRIKAFESSGEKYEPLAVILPIDIRMIFMRFCEAFENLFPAVQIFACHYMGKNKNMYALKRYIGDIGVLTVPVKHCWDAWGIVLDLGSEGKIVYSGDTAPCQTLVDAGSNCTLLIHEASVDDDKFREAVSKNHSTPSGVIDVAEKMNAKFTIMTHFSKRYLAFPILPENCPSEVACAFDFMKVRLDDLALLPLFTPLLKETFESQMKVQEEQFPCFTNIENTFEKYCETLTVHKKSKLN